MSTLYKRGQTVYIDFTDQWNIRHQRSLKLKLLRDGKFPPAAKEIQKQIDIEIAYGSFGVRQKTPRITITQLQDEYIAFVQSERDTQTIYLYKLAVQWLIKFLGDIPIASITQEMMIQFREFLLEKSIPHASRTLRSLSPMFRFAAEQKRWIPSSPINRYTAVTVQQKKRVVFTDTELQVFFEWAKKNWHHFYNQIFFLYLTGFRSNESCTIKWSDIDFQRKELLHYDDKEDAHISYPIDEELSALLRSIPKRIDDDYIFHYRSIHSLDHFMLKARKEIPLRKELKIHTLKVMYVRNLIDAQLSEVDTHRLSHHKSIATTTKYYATFNLNKLRKSLAKSRKKIAVNE